MHSNTLNMTGIFQEVLTAGKRVTKKQRNSKPYIVLAVLYMDFSIQIILVLACKNKAY